MDKDIILAYIQNAHENPCVDFKRDIYTSLTSSDFPKDISAFANAVSEKDKYIIFGVEDTTHEVVGIDPDSFLKQDNIDDYIARTIEPFVNVDCGIFEMDGKYIGYIKVFATNENPPYIIKEDCGKNNKIKKGDIYIRKGTCNLRASRADIDAMHLRNGNIDIRVYDDYAVIGPIHFENELPADPTYGRIRIEIFNDTTRPVLINDGYISLKLGDYCIKRSIVSILPSRRFREYPLEISSQLRRVYTVLFLFGSQDCVDFGFDVNGYLDKPVNLQIVLFDTEKNEYISNEIEASLSAKGDILHKVKRKNNDENKKHLSIKDKIKFWLNK